MEFEQEFEYEQDYPYCDEEGTELYLTEEADYSTPHFCPVCHFASFDCVCGADNDECPTCGGDIVDCACTLERRRRREERYWASVEKVPGELRTTARGADPPRFHAALGRLSCARNHDLPARDAAGEVTGRPGRIATKFRRRFETM
jgi:hypothetical protein